MPTNTLYIFSELKYHSITINMKTIKEQALEYAITDENGCAWSEGGEVRVDISEDVEQAFLAGAKAATHKGTTVDGLRR